MAEKPDDVPREAGYPVPTYSPKYKPPVFGFQELAEEKVDYFLVLDFEAVINKDEGCPELMEMIEFPVLKVNATTLKTEAEFHSYIQPIIHRKLNPVVTEITGITQDMVDGKPVLPEVLKNLDEWMVSQGLLKQGVKFIFVTCGDWDLKTGLSTNCDYLKLNYKDYLKRWINIKTYFGDTMGKKGDSMKTMLNDLALTLDGRHHSGIDDSRNIAKILRNLAERNASLRRGLVKPRVLERRQSGLKSASPKSRRGENAHTGTPQKRPDIGFEEHSKEKVDFFLVLDFKAVRVQGLQDMKEIIELSVLKVDVKTLETMSSFHSFIKPVLQTDLSFLASNLTGVTEDLLCGQPTLPDVLKAFDEWLKSQGLLSDRMKFVFVTFGDWNLKTALPLNCDGLKLAYPDYLKQWVNIKKVFQEIMGKSGRDVATMLRALGLSSSERDAGVSNNTLSMAQILLELMRRDPSLGQGWVQSRVLARSEPKPVEPKKTESKDLDRRKLKESTKESAKIEPKPPERRDAMVYNTPLFKYMELPRQKMDYFLVLDFEANQNKRFPDVKEIIEFPVLKVNTRTLATESTFHTYVQPTVEPNITPFITELTGITQDMVRGQPVLPDVLKQLHHWLASEGLLDRKVNFIFVTCGDWDLKKALPINCDFLRLAYPDYLKRWVNIKKYFKAVMGQEAIGMENMLSVLRLRLDGKHHSGIDDSKNIAKLMVELMKRDRTLHDGWVQPRLLYRCD